MLKLSMKPGEFIQIGEDIRIIFSGGSANNMRVLVDAPREYNIVRDKVLSREETSDFVNPYYKEPGLSEEAKKRIRRIIASEKRKQEMP